MADRVRPLKIETPAEGGTQTDFYPTEVNPNQDGVDVFRVFLQSPTTSDGLNYLDRDPSDQDARINNPVVGTLKTSHLVSNSLTDTNPHQALVDLIHFVDEGPGDGWASGAVKYRVGTAPNAGGWVWYTDTTRAKRILDVTYAYPTGVILPSTKTWRLYKVDGVTVAITAVDTYTWAGPVVTSKLRTWSK